MSAMATQINGVSIVYLTVCSDACQGKHQSSESLAFMKGIHRWTANSPRKGPVTRKMFPFDDVIMYYKEFVKIRINEITWINNTITCNYHWLGSWNKDFALLVWYNYMEALSTLLGWGLLNHLPPFRYYLILSTLSKHTLCIEYHVYIWQVSPQPSCGDTCQIWMWFKEPKVHFCEIEYFAYG